MSLPISWTDANKRRPPKRAYEMLVEDYKDANRGRNVSVPDYARGVIDGYDLARRFRRFRRRQWFRSLTGTEP